MESNITKQEIKRLAAKLWKVYDDLEPIMHRGYYLHDQETWSFSTREYVKGAYDYTFEYMDDEGPHMAHYWGTDKKTVPVNGCSRFGSVDLIPTIHPGADDALSAFGADRTLYELFKLSSLHYDGKIRITVETCICPMNYEKYTDGYYTEVTYTINRKGQVFESKPKPFHRSVLVALNID